MSSHGREESRGDGLIGSETTVDLVAELSTKRSDGLGPGIAGGQAVIDVGPARSAQADLGYGDPVEGDVQLPVPAAVEAMTDGVAGPDRDRCGAGLEGEGGPRVEATDACRLADDLGGGQRATAGELKEGRGEPADEVGDLALEAAHGARQLHDAGQQVAGEAGDRLRPFAEGGAERRLDDRPAERARAGSSIASSTRYQRRRCS